MLNSHPQSGPQVKFAVPLPSAFRVLIANVWPLLTPGPQPGLADELFAVIVAVPVPALSSVKVTSIEVKAHPVLPTRVAVHDPANCDTASGCLSTVWP